MTGKSKIRVVSKKILTFGDFRDYLVNYVVDDVESGLAANFPIAGFFKTLPALTSPGAGIIALGATGGPFLATDGKGRQLSFTNTAFASVPLPAGLADGTVVSIGLERALLDQGVEVNPRTQLVNYRKQTEAIGRRGTPNAVVDNGDGTLTLTVDAVTEAGVNYSGRTITVWLKPLEDGGLVGPQSPVEATAIETRTIAFASGSNKITTVGKLGQGVTPSTTAADYVIVLNGPTVKRKTTEDLTATAGVVFVGETTATGGNAAAAIDASRQVLLLDQPLVQSAISTVGDRALEVLVTPGAIQKKCIPLSEESSTLNPRLLIVGKDTDAGLANGKVRLRPVSFEAGVLGDVNSIALSALQKTNLDSPTIANNSSGSTRTDLLYAAVSPGLTPLTRLVALGVVQGVASGTPLASLPADSGSTYNFGLAALSIPNGFAGGAINQSVIKPLWSSGWVQQQRVRGQRPASLYGGSATEKPANNLSDRIGSDVRVFAHFKYLTTTGTAFSTGFTIDSNYDWRNRFVSGFIAYLGSASQVPLEGTAPQIVPTASATIACAYTGATPPTNGIFASLSYNTNGAVINLGVDGNGNLRGFQSAGKSPIDAANGDLIVIMLHATDRLLATI
jgi:hypothetical protein